MADQDRLVTFVRKIAITQKFATHNVKITPISSGGANYSSNLYVANISGNGRDDLKLFLKVSAMGEKLRGQTPINVFKNEQLAYTELLKTYRALEEKHKISREHQFRFPKFYGVDMTQLPEILVLEDLGSRGFESANRFKSIDWGYAAAAFTELAKFHALSMAYQHEYPEEYNNILTSFPTELLHDNEYSDVFYKELVKQALETVREENRERLKSWLEGKNIFTYTGLIPGKRRQVIVHMDFRPSNMLHSIRDDGTLEIYTVDYQVIRGGSPVIDLLYFIFASSDGEFRAKHFQQLLDHYHSELGAALSRFGLDVKEQYPKENFELDIKEKLSFGLLFSVIFLPVMTVSEEQAPKVDDSFDIVSFSKLKTGPEHHRRFNDAIEDFIAWGVL